MCSRKAERASGAAKAGMPLLSFAPFFIGMRYVLRKKLSYLAMVGIAISVATLVVVMSVMTGFSRELKSVIRGYLSDVSIHSRTGGPYGLTDWPEVRQRVLEVDHVAAVAPFIQGYGFAVRRFREDARIMRVVTFKGVDPELEKGVSDLAQYVRQQGGLGRLKEVFIGENDARVPACLLGQVLAELLMLYPGHNAKITLITVSGRAFMDHRIKNFAANGVFKTGEYDYDSGWVILPLDVAQDFVRSEGGVSGLNVKLDDYSMAPQVVPAIRTALGPDFIVETWEDQRRPFLEAVAMERFLQGVIMSFIMILAGFCIFAILTTMVYEKRRDIGTLKAIGSTRGQIASVFLLAGLSVGLIGAVLGVFGGTVFCDNINVIEQFIERTFHFTPFPPDVYYFDRIPTDEGLLIPLIVGGGAVLCSLIFSLFPALRASRLDPVETLRFE